MNEAMQDGMPMLEHQAVEDWNTATGLPQAVDDWRTARREAQAWPTQETTGLYCAATDQLARTLLGDFVTEPWSQAVFSRFYGWLLAEDEKQSR